ncbi:SpsI protein [Fictibacillus macauensis ZFHKF-1]|uniref:Glucose-1-phosphate thymidylyltransferase n=1 Tax=Fictibacillus macauensis ZFHKF-1 TaxID=1196324 RepID=I8AGS9_9BACL|nr:sugar phosphate nucleotidyltransferase [Fictibacillus macauensis]EIT84614.1 SpsI protein [Fictibacillus macauensis ZFHKF-1]
MKGIILAGGTGSRLQPLTTVINKHLLPIGQVPMILHSVQKMKEAGIHHIAIVTNEDDIPSFQKLLGDGHNEKVNIQYAKQEGARGIADGIAAGRRILGCGRCLVILGDNLFDDALLPYIERYLHQPSGAKVLLKKVSDPHRYGIAQVNETLGEIEGIEEKPKIPKSSYCVTGIYMFDDDIDAFIEKIEPSARGELEITDVNNMYIQQSILTYDIMDGWWLDAGTHEALHEANCHFWAEGEDS